MNHDAIRVWDPFVRIGHWTVVVAFALAYVTEDDLLLTHVWAGYVVGVVVAMRIVWGFIGPRHARFSDFVRGPSTILTYLLDLIRFRAERHVGHSPAGGAMVVVLLLSLAATVISGLITYGADKKGGPLAPLYAAGEVATGATAPQLIGAALADERKGDLSRGERGDEQESAAKELHELLADLTLVLIVLHILGVALASIVHRENLVRAMITGRKRREPNAD